MIVKQLLKEGYCFAVMRSFSYLTQAKKFPHQEWEILALREDKKTLSKLGFVLNNEANTPERHRNPMGIISRVLELEEIAEFRQLIEDYFVEVVKNEDGAVWEVKGQSLKEKLKTSKI